MAKVGFTKAKVSDNKANYIKWQHRVKGLNGGKLKVGIFGDLASAKHADSDATNVDIASFHEFGTTHTPERSFVRASVDENEKEIKSRQRRIAALTNSGKLGEGQGLSLLGEFVAAKIIEKIRTNIAPALSEATIKAKGSSTALIDSGQLVQSITYAVELGKAK